jgi:hypothetical protein
MKTAFLLLAMLSLVCLRPAAGAETAAAERTELQQLVSDKEGQVTKEESEFATAEKALKDALSAKPALSPEAFTEIAQKFRTAYERLSQSRGELLRLQKAEEQAKPTVGGLSGVGIFAIALVVVVVCLVAGYLFNLRNSSAPPQDDAAARVRLAQDVTIGAMTFIVVISVCTLLFAGINAALPPYNEQKTAMFFDMAKWVLGTILPVVGAWVGGVMAYYFGKDNMQTGVKLGQLSAQQKLDSKTASDTDVGLNVDANLATFTVPAGTELKNVTLSELITAYTKNGKEYNRLPILDSTHLPLACLHRSTLDSYRSTLVGADAQAQFNTMTFEAFCTAASWVPATSFGTVSPEDKLTKVQSIIKAASCKDVFVTADGTPSKPAMRWITNDDITQVVMK